MAVDAALLEAVVAGESPPVFRVYGWSSPAVSLGYNQDAAQELDADRCVEAGVEVVRRLTGGRAVLHWEELTYSLVCGRDDPLVGGSTQETYRTIGLCLVAGLRLCGLEPELERSVPSRLRRDPAAAGRGEGRHAPCFASAARWEIKCRGRKLVGSAQRRMGDGILQHGSIPAICLPPLPVRHLLELANLVCVGERCWPLPLRNQFLSFHLPSGEFPLLRITINPPIV